MSEGKLKAKILLYGTKLGISLTVDGVRYGTLIKVPKENIAMLKWMSSKESA